MNMLDIALVALVVAGAAFFLVRRWRKSLNPDLPPCCSGCSGCPGGGSPAGRDGNSDACPSATQSQQTER